MTITFANFLDVIRRVVPRELLSPEAVQRLTATVGDIPDDLSAGYILECRLNEDMQMDLGIVIDPEVNPGRSMFAQDYFEDDLPDRYRTDPVWQQLLPFFRQWDDKAQPLHTQVATAWLEFDMDGAASAQPSIFFGLDAETWQRTAAEATTNPRAFDWLIDALRLLDPAVSDPNNLRRCLAAVPITAEVFQLGLMLARGKHDVRLCVRGKPDAALIDYLPRIGWAGDAPQLTSLLTTLASLVDNIALDVDVSTSLGSRVGIECRFDDWKQPAKEPRWATFLDYLESSKLCTPAKREALPKWPDAAYHRFTDDEHVRVLLRTLNHIKLVLEPGQPLTAKAYLWGGSRPMSYFQNREMRKRLKNT